MSRAVCAGTIVIALFLSGTSPRALADDATGQNASGNSQAEPESTASEVPPGHLQKGDQEWGLLAGVGIAHDIGGGIADREFLTLGGRIGRILTNQKGPGFLKGNAVFAVEILPVFLMFQEQTTYGASFTLLLHHYMAPNSKVKPFLSLGAGALFSTDPIPPEAARVNFTLQAGIGIMWFPKTRLAYFLEYRIHHISNAELNEVNPGINSSYIQFGVSIFR